MLKEEEDDDRKLQFDHRSISRKAGTLRQLNFYMPNNDVIWTNPRSPHFTMGGRICWNIVTYKLA